VGERKKKRRRILGSDRNQFVDKIKRAGHTRTRTRRDFYIEKKIEKD
jgi:hypothetical protein